MVSGETILNTSAPIYALQSVIPSEDDATFVDLMEGEMLTLRQIDEEGTVHTICLSPLMVAEVAKLFDGFIHLPASLSRRNLRLAARDTDPNDTQHR